MKVIGLGKEGLEEGKVYEVGTQVGETLIERGLCYEEGKEKPSAKKGRKPKA